MYPYEILLFWKQIFNLSLLIQKLMLLPEEWLIFTILIPNLKIIRGPVSHDIRTKWDYFSFSKRNYSTNCVELKQNSWFTPRKRDLSCHYAMHGFHEITPNILLFLDSCPEERINHVITPTTGGASLTKWNLFN